MLGLINAATVEGASGRDATRTGRRRNLRDAITHLERAIRVLGPDGRHQLHFTLGRLYLRTGEPAKAVDALNASPQSEPRFCPGALVARSGLRGEQGSEERDCHARGDRRGRAAGRVCARAVSGAGRPAEGSRRELHRALAVQPTSRELKVRRIAVLLDAKEFDARPRSRPRRRAASGRSAVPASAGACALRRRRSVRRDPAARAGGEGNPEGHRHALRARRPLQRRRTRQRCRAHAPSDLSRRAEERRRAELSRLPAGRSRRALDEAIRLVQRALKEEPDNRAYLDSLGWALLPSRRSRRGREVSGAAAKQMPKNSVVQDHLGDLLARRGRWRTPSRPGRARSMAMARTSTRAAIEKKISNAKGKVQNAK